MGVSTVQTQEYKCERCGWKWTRRINGKDLVGNPGKCARCKTPLWNYPRKRIMLKGAYRNAVNSNKEFVKRRFLDLYNTQKDIAPVTQKERDKFGKLAFDINAELDRAHF
jgi:hypothetical protein